MAAPLATKRDRLVRAHRILRRLLPYTREHWPLFLAASGSTILFVLADLARPWPIKIVIDQVILGEPWSALPARWSQPDQRFKLLVVACLALLVLAALAGLFSYLRTILLARAGHEVVAKLRRDVHRHLMRLSLTFHARQRSGDLLVRLTGDSSMMKTLLVEGAFSIVQEMLLLVGVAVVMLWMDLQLTLIAAVTIPVVTVIITRYGTRLRRAAGRQRRKEGQIGAAVNENLSAIGVIQAYSLEGEAEKRFRKQNRNSKKAGLAAARLEGAMSRWTEMAIAAGTAALLFLGSRQVLAGELSAGELVVFVSYVRTLYKPLRRLSTRFAKVLKSAACGERLLSVLEAPIDLTEPAHPLVLTRSQGRVTFDRVHYHYDPAHVVLTDVSFSIEPGERIALLGANGAGKTTLVTMIPRLRDPSSGRVLVDGHDVRTLQLQSLRRQVGLVFQHTVLFDGTLLDNVCLGWPGASLSDIDRALDRSGLGELAQSLPRGLETPVGEGGFALSGGQRQRVALARALLRKARILVLDEPTNSLDEASGDLLHREIIGGLDDCTVVLITHRSDVSSSLDRVVVLREGHVVADGPPPRVLEKRQRLQVVQEGRSSMLDPDGVRVKP